MNYSENYDGPKGRMDMNPFVKPSSSFFLPCLHTILLLTKEFMRNHSNHPVTNTFFVYRTCSKPSHRCKPPNFNYDVKFQLHPHVNDTWYPLVNAPSCSSMVNSLSYRLICMVESMVQNTQKKQMRYPLLWWLVCDLRFDNRAAVIRFDLGPSQIPNPSPLPRRPQKQSPTQKSSQQHNRQPRYYPGIITMTALRFDFKDEAIRLDLDILQILDPFLLSRRNVKNTEAKHIPHEIFQGNSALLPPASLCPRLTVDQALHSPASKSPLFSGRMHAV